MECLRLVTTKDMPPNALNGQNFVTDPKLIGKPEVKGKISLKFHPPSDNENDLITVHKTFQLTSKGDNKMSFKALNHMLKRSIGGVEAMVDETCVEMQVVVPRLLGVTKAVIENVIFCHQEESTWPFGENKKLKEIFDDLFNTTWYKNF